MKVMMTIISLICASTVMANTSSSDIYNAEVTVKLKSVKCTIFGRLKMKLEGIEDSGNIAKKYLKSVRKYDESCKISKGRILQQLNGNRTSINATISTSTTEVRRTVWRNSRDHRGNGRWGTGYEYDHNYPVCETYSEKRISVQLSQLMLEDSPLKLARTKSTYMGSTWGVCR